MGKEKNSKKREKKNKTGLIIGIVLGVIIIAVVGIFLFKYIMFKKPIDEVWGNIYYEYLINNQEKNENLPKNVKKMKIKFIKPIYELWPIMVTTYEIKDEIYTNIYYIEENNVKSIIYDTPASLELLYNINYEEYYYYVHTLDGNENNYNVLNINNMVELEDLELNYTFYKNEKGELEGFNTVLMKPSLNDSRLSEFNTNDSKMIIKSAVEKAIDNYLPQEKIITDDVKVNTINQLKKLQRDNLEEIKKGWYVEIISDNVVYIYDNKNKDNILGAASKGEIYKALDVDTETSTVYYWYKIKFENKTGWILSGRKIPWVRDVNNPNDIADPIIKFKDSVYKVSSIDDINYDHIEIIEDTNNYKVAHKIYHEVRPSESIDQYWIMYIVTDGAGKSVSKMQKIEFETKPDESQVLNFSEYKKDN